MSLRDKIMNDVKLAMKSKDSIKLETLRFLQSAIKYREIELRPQTISESEILSVLKRMIKQRKDSIDQYKQGQRLDLVEKESTELNILESYLPDQLSSEKLNEIIKNALQKVGAKSIKDMGAVMKEVLLETQGNADNKIVSEIIKVELSKLS